MKQLVPGVYDAGGELHVDLCEFILASGGDPTSERDQQTAIRAIEKVAGEWGIPTETIESPPFGTWQ